MMWQMRHPSSRKQSLGAQLAIATSESCFSANFALFVNPV
jgi:hypothetical protein